MNIITTSNNNRIAATGFSADLFQSWISFLDVAPKTESTYTRAIKRFAVYLNDNGIVNPTREDIISYREDMKQGHKPATVQSYLAAVKVFFRWTEQEGLYPNIADHVKGVKLDNGNHKKDYLTKNQSAALLNKIDRSTPKGRRDYAIISLAITTGLRTIEIVRANVGDIRPLGEDTVLYIQGKGHEDRNEYVKLVPAVEEAIKEMKADRDKTANEDPLFVSASNRNGQGRMTTRSMSRIVKDAMKAIGLDSDRLTAHSLRHTAATLNLLNGGTLEETQQLLRHRNINTTMIYANALSRAENRSESRIADAIFS